MLRGTLRGTDTHHKGLGIIKLGRKSKTAASKNKETNFFLKKCRN
jgi:hypothetical protein